MGAFWGGGWAGFGILLASVLSVTKWPTGLLVEGGLVFLASCKVINWLTRLLVDFGVALGVFWGGGWAGFGILLANVLSVTKWPTGLLVEGGLVLLASCQFID